MISSALIVTSIKLGIIGGTVIYWLLAVAYYMDICEIDITGPLGKLVTKDNSKGSSLVGFLIYLLISSFIAFVYAICFSLLKMSGLVQGFIFGTVHLMITSALFSSTVLFLPEFRKRILHSFLTDKNQFRIDILILVVLHLVYGTVIGELYTTLLLLNS